MTLKIEVQIPLGRIVGMALPLNVAGGAVVDEGVMGTVEDVRWADFDVKDFDELV